MRLTIKKSDNAPEVILKLSEIMQYVLYDAKGTSIKLSKEINYVHSYLELEKLRYGSNIESNLNIDGNIDSITVPPLLFLPFIENCFKHGAKNNDNILVNINFEKKNSRLLFKVENNFNIQNKPKAEHGIGIENVKRRLQLLYDNKFKLNTHIFENKYVVQLSIPI